MKMKRVLLFLAMALCLAVTAALTTPRAEAAAGDVTINETNFPDANFRAIVSADFDTDHNGALSAASWRPTWI